ncbi:hypothetical protein [Propionivibrio sp.]|uniref:hypothetical protein n=1 Tax=Propionivibrio sp. TaxID=2212460 RepID=UPI003BF2749F
MRFSLIRYCVGVVLVLAVCGLYLERAFVMEMAGLGKQGVVATIPLAEKPDGGKDFRKRPGVRKQDSVASKEETKGGDRKEMDRGNELFVLLLQILRSPR